MKKLSLLFVLLFVFTACNGKEKSTPEKTPEKTDTTDDVKDEKVEKGPPPALPSWALVPQKGDSMGEVQAKSTSLSLQVSPEVKVRIEMPFKIYQVGNLLEENGAVAMPVRVETGNYWLNGTLDMMQVEIRVPAGTILRDDPKGVPVAFFEEATLVQIKELKDGWLEVSHEMNTKCSPSHLKGWLKKEDLLKVATGKAKVPGNFAPMGGAKNLPHTVPMFDVHSRATGGEKILYLPLCKGDEQVILVPKGIWGKKGRTRVYFKPTKTSPVTVVGWVEKASTDEKAKGDCTCRTNLPKTHKVGKAEIDSIYATRTLLPLYAGPDAKSKPIGVLTQGKIVNYMKYYRNAKFAVVEIINGVKLYTPFHDNYFFP
ncbi:hypothetical protein KKF34_18435 [Myxococcota bacterium]|nr:hypothetical protein [Myxococcota bacterium]MBU1381832.1 hypothetical protein [Myxococcota bacterium]MBU1498863.1 hypothetical protein [Myxococcota bacterium]